MKDTPFRDLIGKVEPGLLGLWDRTPLETDPVWAPKGAHMHRVLWVRKMYASVMDVGDGASFREFSEVIRAGVVAMYDAEVYQVSNSA